MKNLRSNPFFYLSLMLAFAVAFEVFNLVQAQTAPWTPPTVAPPGGNPAQPVDTSAATQSKSGGFTVVAPSATYGVKVDPYGHIWLGQNSGNGTINTTQGGIYFNGTNLQYTNNGGATWSDIGSGSSIGAWPISIPTVGSQGNGFFGFKLTGNSWSGFDLSGNQSNRLVLGVSSAQINNGQNVFDVEGPINQNQWNHMFELRANGSASFAGSVQAAGYYDSHNDPVPAIGTWCGLYDGKNTVWACNGYNPGADQCPAGYLPVAFGKLYFGKDWRTCVFGTTTGTPPTTPGGIGGSPLLQYPK